MKVPTVKPVIVTAPVTDIVLFDSVGFADGANDGRPVGARLGEVEGTRVGAEDGPSDG